MLAASGCELQNHHSQKAASRPREATRQRVALFMDGKPPAATSGSSTEFEPIWIGKNSRLLLHLLYKIGIGTVAIGQEISAD